MDVEGLEEGVLETVPWDKVVNIKPQQGNIVISIRGVLKKVTFRMLLKPKNLNQN